MNTEPFDGLQEFDLVLFRPGGNWFERWVGQAVCWFQAGMGCKSPEFCHVAVALKKDGQLVLFQTNPPAPSYRGLDTVDWDNVAVMGIQRRITEPMISNAHWWAEQKVKKGADPYGVPSIVGFLGLGLLGRVWPGATRAILKGRNRLASQSMEVCSQLTDDLFFDVTKLDILPDIGEGQAVPGDLTGSTAHRLVFGKLGA